MQFWFGSRVDIADVIDIGWDADAEAYYIDAKFIKGHMAALRQPFSVPDQLDEAADLQQCVLRPLQRHLREAGFDGLVWQAGYGNPVALSNFLCVRELAADDDQAGEAVDGAVEHPHRWIWIDMESGVPALIPINPLKLLGFYIPKCFKHRRPLFDDVDTKRLRRYVAEQAEPLTEQFDEAVVTEMQANVDALEEAQDRWRKLPRAHRAIEYQLGRGRLTQEQADYYKKHTLRWYGRCIGYVATRALPLAARVLRKLGGLFKYALGIGRYVRNLVLFLVSPKFRAAAADAYARLRILHWQGRNQLAADQARTLRNDLREGSGSSTYLSDFIIHMAIKPAVKLTTWGVILPLALAGVIPPVLAGILLVFGGSIGRCTYTLIRGVSNLFRGREIPWVALAAGALPAVGNSAFLLQLAFTGRQGQDRIAQFLLYDAASQLACRVPIWGGEDTGIEHFANRIVFRILHHGRLSEDASAEAGAISSDVAAGSSSDDDSTPKDENSPGYAASQQ